MRVLVLTHGNLGRELIDAAKTISGEIPGMESLCLDWEAGVEEARERVLSAVERLKEQGKEVLILTDMFGSTPSNLACSLREEGRVEVLAGVNLPMVLRIACLKGKGLGLSETAHWLLEKGRSSICEGKDRSFPQPSALPEEGELDPCLEPGGTASMTEREIEVVNRLGLHARAAAKLVHLAGSFSCRVELVQGGDVVDAKSILGILMLGAAQGTRLSVRCDGEGEAEALEAIAALFNDRFDEGS